MPRLHKRFRWPLVAGLSTLLILAYLLQPRPMAEYRLPGNSDLVKISRNGKFLALCGDMDVRDAVVQIYHLPTMEKMLTHTWQVANESAFSFSAEFDPDDNMVFAVCASSKPTAEDATVQLWHWQQGQSVPRLVKTIRAFSPDRTGNFRGLYKSDSKSDTDCILSPDARNWLIPVTDGKAIHFELIDTQTGDSVRLDMPVVEIENPSIFNLTVAFSTDSHELVTDSSTFSTIDEKNNNARLIRWFDVRTGKLLYTKVLDLPDQFDLYGQLHILQREKVIAISQKVSQLTLQLHTDTAGHQSIPMSETVANPAERPWPKPKDSADWNLYPDPDCKSVLDGNKSMLIYWWEHLLFPRSGNSTWPRSIPGFYFGVRELNTGKLIHTERLPDRPRQPDDWNPEGWRMLGVLPGPSLLLKQPEHIPPTWQVKWEEWREKYIPWCPFLPIKPLRLLFIEPTTGKRLTELSLPFTRVSHHFHSQQQALYLVGYAGDDLVIQKYAYPLHKPWLLILTWALSIFAILATFQWLPQKLRRARPPLPTRERG